MCTVNHRTPKLRTDQSGEILCSALPQLSREGIRARSTVEVASRAARRLLTQRDRTQANRTLAVRPRETHCGSTPTPKSAHKRRSRPSTRRHRGADGPTHDLSTLRATSRRYCAPSHSPYPDSRRILDMWTPRDLLPIWSCRVKVWVTLSRGMTAVGSERRPCP